MKINKEILVSDGGVFACAAGDWKEDTNIGQLDAVVRVVYLKTR